MSNMAIDAARLMDILPEEDKKFAYEFIKKLVKAWDPDFTKVTPEEAQSIQAAEESGFIADSEIDWDNLSDIVEIILHIKTYKKFRTFVRNFFVHRRNRVALFGFFYLMIMKGELNSFLNLSRRFLR